MTNECNCSIKWNKFWINEGGHHRWLPIIVNLSTQILYVSLYFKFYFFFINLKAFINLKKPLPGKVFPCGNKGLGVRFVWTPNAPCIKCGKKSRNHSVSLDNELKREYMCLEPCRREK